MDDVCLNVTMASFHVRRNVWNIVVARCQVQDRMLLIALW